MKSVIKEETKEIVFPCLMIWPSSKMLVLFHQNRAGIVVDSGNSSWEVGTYSSTWADSSEWSVFNGSITLSNDGV